jgi:hypothetical protein
LTYVIRRRQPADKPGAGRKAAMQPQKARLWFRQRPGKADFCVCIKR